MSTPNGTTVWAHEPNGVQVEITEGVQVLYDLVVNGMEFGSGFLHREEVMPLLHLARLCGFGETERVESYLREVDH